MQKNKKSRVFRQVAFSHTIITGINSLIEKGVIRIDGNKLFVFEEITGHTTEKKSAFIKNAYLYFRLKLKKPQGTIVEVINIETNQLIGTYNSRPILPH